MIGECLSLSDLLFTYKTQLTGSLIPKSKVECILNRRILKITTFYISLQKKSEILHISSGKVKLFLIIMLTFIPIFFGDRESIWIVGIFFFESGFLPDPLSHASRGLLQRKAPLSEVPVESMPSSRKECKTGLLSPFC